MKLLFVGDVMLGRMVNEALKSRPPEYPWGNTLSLFKMADIKICNLECAITDYSKPWSNTSKVFFFATDPKNVAVLQAAGITAVANANNHAMDYRYIGLSQMIKILDKAKILHAGSGKDFKEASRPATVKADSLKIAFISFTDNEPWAAAGGPGGGIFYIPVDIASPRAKVLFDLVSQSKKNHDLVIVSAHWGPNWGYNVQPNHIPFAHSLIEAGADIVFGHSCHVFQAVEIYKGKPIMYSTGDFIDDYQVDPIERNDQSFIFIVETDGDKLTKLNLYPVIISNLQVNLAKPTEAEEIAAKMKNLCRQMGTKAVWSQEKKLLEIKID